MHTPGRSLAGKHEIPRRRKRHEKKSLFSPPTPPQTETEEQGGGAGASSVLSPPFHHLLLLCPLGSGFISKSLACSLHSLCPSPAAAAAAGLRIRKAKKVTSDVCATGGATHFTGRRRSNSIIATRRGYFFLFLTFQPGTTDTRSCPGPRRRRRRRRRRGLRRWRTRRRKWGHPRARKG